MGGIIIFAVVGFLTASLCFLFGYLIRVKQMAGLIGGYNPRTVKDKDGLTRWVGGNLYLMGGMWAGFALWPLVTGAFPGLWFILGFSGLFMAVTIWTAVGCQRYQH